MTDRIPRITGTFVDFSERTHRDWILLDWGLEEWRNELTDIKEAGIDTVILHRSMRYGAVYYLSNRFETHLERDWIRPFIEAAEETGLKVFLAGLVSDHFFSADDETFVRLMERDVYIYRTLISELLDLFEDFDCISGIYVSHEADAGNLRSPARIEAAKKFFGTLYAGFKDRTDLPVLSSPFFTRDTGPDELAGFWASFLDRPMFDIVAMQDGVGCDRHIGPEHVEPYFKPLADVFKSRGITFWHNAESFSFHPGFRRSGFDRKKIWLHPAPLARLDAQVRSGEPWTEKTVTWEYGHFMSRVQVGEDWYRNFKNWNLGGAA